MLTSELAAFIEAGQVVHIGTRNEQLDATGALGIAATVDAGRTHVTVYLQSEGADEVLANLRDNGRVAVCFARPPDERACQVKGTFVDVRQATMEERPVVEAQWEHCLRQLEQIGYSRALYAGHSAWPCLAVRMRATDVFDQTPGPGAGAPLTGAPLK
jgi:Pyridoxamine 5'-phosphate oxidase